MVVERLELAIPGVAQHLVEAALLGLAGEERNSERLRLRHLGRQLGQHRNAAGDVKAADAHRETGGDEAPGKIDGARKLVRLDADEADQRLSALLADHPHDPVRPDAPIGLVIGVQPDIDVGAENLAPPRVVGEGVQARQRIGGNSRAEPLDRIAVVVVMRRLDHDEMK